MDKERISSYRETQIKTASKGKLVVLLYDGLIRFLDIALENLPKKRYDLVNENLLKAQDIISELMMSLNFEAGDISHKLLSIYSFFNSKLIEGNIKKEQAPIAFVRRMSSDLRDAWNEISKKGKVPELNEMKKEGGIDVAG
jgi:flagellar secretion chaperone FliS